MDELVHFGYWGTPQELKLCEQGYLIIDMRILIDMKDAISCFCSSQSAFCVAVPLVATRAQQYSISPLRFCRLLLPLFHHHSAILFLPLFFPHLCPWTHFYKHYLTPQTRTIRCFCKWIKNNKYHVYYQLDYISEPTSIIQCFWSEYAVWDININGVNLRKFQCSPSMHSLVAWEFTNNHGDDISETHLNPQHTAFFLPQLHSVGGNHPVIALQHAASGKEVSFPLRVTWNSNVCAETRVCRWFEDKARSFRPFLAKVGEGGDSNTEEEERISFHSFLGIAVQFFIICCDGGLETERDTRLPQQETRPPN